DSQVFQTFNFQDTTREFVDLAFLLNGQNALLDTVQRNGVNQIAQCDTRLHFAFKTNQNRLRHIQRHNAGSGGERHQTRTGREGNAQRETGVRVTTGTHGIRQQHTVQPGVDDAVARAQRHTATGADEVGQSVLHLNVNRLRIRRGVTERLHHQIRREAQTGQVFQLITGHRTGGVLRTNGGHFRFAVRARTNPFVFRQATGLTHHYLRQGEAFAAGFRIVRQTEGISSAQTQSTACFVGQTTTDDQRNTATGLYFVQNHVGFERELGDHLTGFVQNFAFIRTDFDHVAHVHLVDRCFEYQSAGVFHGIEEDRGDFGTDTYTAAALVRYARNIVTEEPQYGVGRGLSGRTSTHHVTHEGNRQAFGFDGFNLLHRAGYAVLFGRQTIAGHFVCSAGVQRDVRT